MSSVTQLFQNVNMQLSNSINCVKLGKILSLDNGFATIELLHKKGNKSIFPVLIDVPIAQFESGEFEISIKPSIGDKVLVLFLDVDTYEYMINDNYYDTKSDRTHSIEDAIVLPFTIHGHNSSSVNNDDIVIGNNKQYIKINNDTIEIEANKIKLGKNATHKAAYIDTDGSVVASTKVFIE